MYNLPESGPLLQFMDLKVLFNLASLYDCKHVFVFCFFFVFFLTQLFILSRISAGESLMACSRNLNFAFIINIVRCFFFPYHLLLMMKVN